MYFRLKTLGHLDERHYFTDCEPIGVIDTYDLMLPGPLKGEYPKGIGETAIQASDDWPGTELPTCIGNTDGMILWHRCLFEVLTDVSHEIVPVTLLDARAKKTLSDEFGLVHVLGAVDGLDHERCVRGVTDFVEIKLRDDVELGALCRLVTGDVASALYVIREDLVDKLNGLGASNLALEPI